MVNLINVSVLCLSRSRKVAVRTSRIFCLDRWWSPAAWMNFLLQCSVKSWEVYFGRVLSVKKSVFKLRSSPTPPHPPASSRHCPLNKRKSIGLGQGSLVWQNRWHIVCRKHRRLGFDTRGTPKRLKQKRIKNLNVEFSEKAEKFVMRKGVREVGGKSGYVF